MIHRAEEYVGTLSTPIARLGAFWCGFNIRDESLDGIVIYTGGMTAPTAEAARAGAEASMLRRLHEFSTGTPS